MALTSDAGSLTIGLFGSAVHSLKIISQCDWMVTEWIAAVVLNNAEFRNSYWHVFY
jgi:hypothetical protein